VPIAGTYTAIVTPTVGRGEVDVEAYRALLRWQAESGVDGVVVGGTTGESPTLTEAELIRLFTIARETLPSKVEVVAATGRNHLVGSMALTQAAVDLGVHHVLLVDPYYNGPSSLEIRREYLEPIAARFPELGLVPYVIPGRTGTRLDPVDLERMLSDGRRIVGVKDATGEEEYGRELRRRCPGLSILSGDDPRTISMMLDPRVRASGVISVSSNLVPRAVHEMVECARTGDPAGSTARAAPLRPLFDSVTIRSTESGPAGEPVPVRSRNPVPVKTALAILGVKVGECRPPLGRLGPAGVAQLVEALHKVHDGFPDVFRPLEETFGVDVGKRLSDRSLAKGLAYAAW
jgi:4-hydroxy-tetrahydrodipicolinate synthase